VARLLKASPAQNLSIVQGADAGAARAASRSVAQCRRSVAQRHANKRTVWRDMEIDEARPKELGVAVTRRSVRQGWLPSSACGAATARGEDRAADVSSGRLERASMSAGARGAGRALVAGFCASMVRRSHRLGCGPHLADFLAVISKVISRCRMPARGSSEGPRHAQPPIPQCLSQRDCAGLKAARSEDAAPTSRLSGCRRFERF
jgi:hypothetical protein